VQVVLGVAEYLIPITLATSFPLSEHVPFTASVDTAAVVHAASANTVIEAFEQVACVLQALQVEHWRLAASSTVNG
jgi:hypothetical protein